MYQDIYFRDDRPGSFSSISDIKILICYILDELEGNITNDQLNETFQYSEMVNYFNYCQAISELKKSGHIVESETNSRSSVLELTSLGVETSKELRDFLPPSSLERALKTAKKILIKDKQNQGKQIKIEQVEDGYLVHLKILDVGSDFMDIRLFAPDLKQAERIAKEFKCKTVDLYRGIISILYNDYESLYKVSKDIEKASQFSFLDYQEK